MVSENSLWRHKKTNGIYQVITMAQVEQTLEHVVVYRSVLKNGLTWTRPKSEFLDGRFEFLGYVCITRAS